MDILDTWSNREKYSWIFWILGQTVRNTAGYFGYLVSRHGMELPTFARDQSGSTPLAVLVDVYVSWRVRHVGHRPRLPVPCWQHQCARQ